MIGPQLLEGVAGKEGMPFFRGGREDCNFHIKNKLKSEIFDDKKSFLAKNSFLCHKNSNWDILSKNFVIFNR